MDQIRYWLYVYVCVCVCMVINDNVWLVSRYCLRWYCRKESTIEGQWDCIYLHDPNADALELMQAVAAVFPRTPETPCQQAPA